MIERKTWEEFRENKLLWWVNRSLHLFGWAIVLDYDDTGKIEAIPARTKFRGFSVDVEEDGYKKLTKYLADNVEELEKETNE